VLTIDLFTWWIISISWSIAFLIVAGFYLYARSSKSKGEEDTRVRNELKAKTVSISKNFVFVWTLLGLLAFYIFSVHLGTGALSELVFALGNIFVEVLLVFYLFRNRDKTTRSREGTSED
jgi:magnesium-transporting ATPase (P-type)